MTHEQGAIETKVDVAIREIEADSIVKSCNGIHLSNEAHRGWGQRIVDLLEKIDLNTRDITELMNRFHPDDPLLTAYFADSGEQHILLALAQSQRPLSNGAQAELESNGSPYVLAALTRRPSYVPVSPPIAVSAGR